MPPLRKSLAEERGPGEGRTPKLRGLMRGWGVVVLGGTLALSGLAKVGEDVVARDATTFDGAVQRWMLAHQQALVERTFYWITTVGGINGMRALAVVGAVYLWYQGRRRVAAGILVIPVVAVLLFNALKRLYARPRPSGLGGAVDSSYSFPSGHATAAAAVCGALAYVFWREGFIGGRAAAALATIIPLLVGFSRLYLNVHWATDVLGGWCAGLVIAALSAGLYDLQRRAAAVPVRR